MNSEVTENGIKVNVLLRKIKVKLLFLAHLSNREPRKNKETPSLEWNQGEIFYLASFQLENNHWNYKNKSKIVNKKSSGLVTTRTPLQK
jgi:hypothetical protein